MSYRLITCLPVVLLLTALVAGAACRGDMYYHPTYPPASTGVEDLTDADRDGGRAAYVAYVGRTLRPLHAPHLWVSQGMRFSKVAIARRDEDVGQQKWSDPTARVLDVRHLRVHKRDLSLDGDHDEELVDLHLRAVDGREGHWFGIVVPEVRGYDRGLPTDPVDDAIRQFFVPAEQPSRFALAADAPTLGTLLDAAALALFPEPEAAPPLVSAPPAQQVEVRAWLERLHSLPGPALIEGIRASDRRIYHEVAVGAARALGEVGTLPRPLGNSYEQCGAGLLGTVGDPAGVPALVALLAAPSELDRDAAIEALGRIGSPLALAPLDPLTRDPDPERARRALMAMARIVGMPYSRDVVQTMRYRPPDDRVASQLTYGALCYVQFDGYQLRFVREAARRLEHVMQAEPGWARAAVAHRMRAAIERLFGI